MAWRGRHFFKVFIPELTANHLSIPPAFSKLIKIRSSSIVSLTGPSGNIWNVELVKDAERMMFEKGWKEFVADHSILVGDFLVFRYDGHLSFQVLVFSPSACEKDVAFQAKPSADVAVITKKDFLGMKRKRDSDCIREGGSSREQKMQPKCANEAKVEPSEVALDDSLNREGEIPQIIDLESSETCIGGSRDEHKKKNSSERSYKKPRDRQFRVLGRINVTKGEAEEPSAFPLPNGISAGTLTKRKGRPEREATVERTRGHATKYRTLTSRRRPVTVEEMARAVEMAKSFKSRNPSLTAVMQDGNVYATFLFYFPASFSRQHLPRKATELTLLDPKGRRWKVRCLQRGHCSVLSCGWANFSYANNLEKGDVCVFEILKPDEIQVHIFRVVEELAPLIKNHRRKNSLIES